MSGFADLQPLLLELFRLPARWPDPAQPLGVLFVAFPHRLYNVRPHPNAHPFVLGVHGWWTGECRAVPGHALHVVRQT